MQDAESFTSKSSKNLEKFLKSLDEMVKLEEQVKKQTEELERYNNKVSCFIQTFMAARCIVCIYLSNLIW